MRPIIIGIGGAHSGAGKTTYASLLLQRLKGWGAIKYTKTGLYCSLIDDREILLTEDKDTKRMLNAGAERVLWVQSPPSELRDVLPQAMERLSDLKGIVVEGNSAIEFLNPDIIIFVFGNDSKTLKERAKKILERADVIVYAGSNKIIVTSNKSSLFTRRSSLNNEQFISYITEMVEKKEKIRSLLKESSVHGKIPCPLARKIAKELTVPYREVGKAADELNIKITDCELGCF